MTVINLMTIPNLYLILNKITSDLNVNVSHEIITNKSYHQKKGKQISIQFIIQYKIKSKQN